MVWLKCMRRMNPKCHVLTHRSCLVTTFKVNTITTISTRLTLLILFHVSNNINPRKMSTQIKCSRPSALASTHNILLQSAADFVVRNFFCYNFLIKPISILNAFAIAAHMMSARAFQPNRLLFESIIKIPWSCCITMEPRIGDSIITNLFFMFLFVFI